MRQGLKIINRPVLPNSYKFVTHIKMSLYSTQITLVADVAPNIQSRYIQMYTYCRNATRLYSMGDTFNIIHVLFSIFFLKQVQSDSTIW